VLTELEALGASLRAMERTRRYAPEERAAAPYLHATPSTGSLTGPANLRSERERATACPEYDAGCRPVAPLLIRAAEMGRAQVRGANHGLLVVRAGMAGHRSTRGSRGSTSSPPGPRASTVRTRTCAGST
jgi:hypothetical protein